MLTIVITVTMDEVFHEPGPVSRALVYPFPPHSSSLGFYDHHHLTVGEADKEGD